MTSWRDCTAGVTVMSEQMQIWPDGMITWFPDQEVMIPAERPATGRFPVSIPIPDDGGE